MSTLRILVAVALLAGASLATWTLFDPGADRPAVPRSPGTELGLHVRHEGQLAWLCATVQVTPSPSASLTRTQADARCRALLAQACQDAERRLVDELRRGPGGVPDLPDPWAGLPAETLAITLAGLRRFDAPRDAAAGRVTQGLPWPLVVAGAHQALERLRLDDAAALHALLDERAAALAAHSDALDSLWRAGSP